MKRILAWIKANRLDEMGKTISFKSVQWAWMYLVVFLIGWAVFELFNARNNGGIINSLPAFLLSSQTFVLMGSQLLYRYRLAKGEDEERPGATQKNKIAMIIFVSILILIVAVGAYAIIRLLL